MADQRDDGTASQEDLMLGSDETVSFGMGPLVDFVAIGLVPAHD